MTYQEILDNIEQRKLLCIEECQSPLPTAERANLKGKISAFDEVLNLLDHLDVKA